MSIKGSTLSGLATFKVAAQLGSFTKAAHYLHITTGAISQQIRLLETQLSLQLFERHSRGIKLTKVGQQVFQVTQKSFSDIESIINILQKDQSYKGEIRLKLTPSFAYKWLVPRLQNFYKHYPDITIQTFAEGALVDHQDNNFDIAIDYGQSPYSHHPKAELLLSEQLVPVMSAEYYERFDWLNTTEQSQQKVWQSITLLHDAMPWQHAIKHTEWQYWFEEMKLSINSDKGFFFNRTDMAMAAAEAGLGVAMARYALVEKDFQQKRLMSPFSPINAKAGYYYIQHKSSPAIQCFKQWLFSEINS